MSQIFLSHSSRNIDYAVALRDWLAEQGWDDVFLDTDPKRGIASGERWEGALHKAALRCEAVLFLVSDAWLASGWCIKEFHLANRLNKRLFGVFIEDIPLERLPAELTGTWQLVSLISGHDHILRTAVLPTTQQEVDVTVSQEGLTRLKLGLERVGLAKFFAWPPKDDPKRSPYRGLKPLEAEDAGIFFGREAPAIDTLDRLRGLKDAAPPRFLVILGASGAGKSSFLRAGLLPRLARDDRHFLPLPVLRPERAAITGETGLLRALETALAEHGLTVARGEIRQAIEGGAATLRPLLTQLIEKAHASLVCYDGAAPPPLLVLAIDQSEELLQADGAAEGASLLALLKDLLTRDSPGLLVLATIRSDSYEPLQTATLIEGVRQQTLSLPPMPRSAYQTIIEGPAQRLKDTDRSLVIEPALSQALLGDIEEGGGRDSLPLLAFTLERLYLEYGARGRLTLADYNALGRIKGSIESAVERALEAADRDPGIPKDRAARLALLQRGLIPAIASIDPDTGSPRRRVARRSEIPKDALPLIDLLVEQRLLSTDVARDSGEITIEPAHEAFLRQWGPLEGWLKDDSAVLATLEGVKRASRDWEAENRNADWLIHGGGRLKEAEALKEREDMAAQVDEVDRLYIGQCRKREDDEHERLRREAETLKRQVFWSRIFGGVAAFAVLVVGVAGWGLYGANKSLEQSTKSAHENLSSALTALALTELEQRPWNAAKLALAAWPRQGAMDLPKREVTLKAIVDSQARMHERKRITTDDIISSVAFSPDGARVLTGSADKTARLWDASTGELIRAFVGHESDVTSVAFSPDGARVLTGSADKTARLWDAATGQEIRSFVGHESDVTSVAFSPDGKRVLTGSADKTARLWDASTGRQIRAFKGHDRVTSVAFSPDGKRVLTGSGDRTVRLWDAAMGQEVHAFKTHDGHDRVTSVAFSPDGKRVLTGLRDNTARLWDAATGQEIRAFKGHESDVTSVAFSPNGKRVLTGSADNTARLWDAEVGQTIRTFTGDDDDVTSVAFSPDGKRVLTGSRDRTVRLWDAAMGQQLLAFRGHESDVTSVALSPDGARVLTGSRDKTARLWNAATGLEIRAFRGHESEVTSVAFSPDGKRVLTGSGDKTARLWDAATGQQLPAFKGHESDVTSVAFSPDGKRVLTGSRDTIARLWDAATGQEIRAFKGHLGSVSSVAFSPDGARVLTGSEDKTARLWDAATGREIRAFEGHKNSVVSVAFSLDGARVLTGSEDKTARLWDASTGELIRAFEGHRNPVVSVAFSPDGKRVLTGSADNTARLWDASTGQEIHAFTGHESDVTSVAFSPDGKRVLTGSRDKTAQLWNVPDAPPGNILELTCARLPDHDLAGLGKDYGLDLSREPGICQKDENGRFIMPLPESPKPSAGSKQSEAAATPHE